MNLTRKEFLKLLAGAATTGIIASCTTSGTSGQMGKDHCNGKDHCSGDSCKGKDGCHDKECKDGCDGKDGCKSCDSKHECKGKDGCPHDENSDGK